MADLASHYDAVREQFDYDRPDLALGSLSAGVLDRAFAATTDADALRAAAAGDRDTLFVASAGLTGTPHVGTVAQMWAVKRLQDAGFDTAFLLADYEKYAGGGRDLGVVRDLADDYRTFLDGIGYDGRVRTQYDARDVMHTAFRLAPYFPAESDVEWDAEQTDWEAALEAAYEADQVEHDDAGDVTDFGRRLTGLLCLADFTHPALAEGYDQTVFVLGVDEHGLYQVNDHYAAKTPFDAPFEGLFTRLVPGLDGYPKMAKTIPGSGITMDLPPEHVEALVRGAAGDGRPPAESTVYQMLCLVSDYGADRLADLEAACRADGPEWDDAVDEYAAFLGDVAAAWPDASRRPAPDT